MGNYLNTPNSTKTCDNGKLGDVLYAVCSMQGWRLTMEDAHVVHFFEYLPAPVDSPCLFFGVYDGHGGPQVAHYVARHIVMELLKAFEACQGVLETAFRVAYISIDTLLTQESQQAELEYFANPDAGPCPFKPLPTQTPAMVLNKKVHSQIRLNGEKLYRRVRRRHKCASQPKPPVNEIDSSYPSNTTSESFSATVSDEIPSHGKVVEKNKKGFRKPLRSNDNFCTNSDSQNLSIVQTLKTIISSFVTRNIYSNSRSHTFSNQSLAMLSGCTALSVLVTKSQIVVANAGDSRAVLCRGSFALELSRDHKPSLLEEKARIYTAGGWLEMGRINGNLNLSRALGDLIYKRNQNLSPEKQIVSPVPDVVFLDKQNDDEFLIIGCDGIWESCSSQEVIDFIRDRITTAKKLSDILEALFEELLSPNPTLFEYGCDNMTAILVDLRPERLNAAEMELNILKKESRLSDVQLTAA